MLEAYRAHVQERAELGIPPKPLDPEWTAQLVELLKSPPAGEEDFLLDLIANRVPPGVDEAASFHHLTLGLQLFLMILLLPLKVFLIHGLH